MNVAFFSFVLLLLALPLDPPRLRRFKLLGLEKLLLDRREFGFVTLCDLCLCLRKLEFVVRVDLL
jgi:hypothetical protein